MIQESGGPPKDRGLLRKNIRKRVVQILKGKTDAKNRVRPNASTKIKAEQLPVILVYPQSESISEFNQAPRELERELTLAIEIVATGSEVDGEGQTVSTKKSLEDQLDDIAEQIECEMSRDDTLGGVADMSILTGVDMEFDGEGGQPIGSARLTYAITYTTMSPRSLDKQDGLADFDEANVQFNIGDDENTRETEDTIDLTTP